MFARTRPTLLISHFQGSACYNVTENQHDTIMFNQMTCSGVDWMLFVHFETSWNGLEGSSFGVYLINEILLYSSWGLHYLDGLLDLEGRESNWNSPSGSHGRVTAIPENITLCCLHRIQKAKLWIATLPGGTNKGCIWEKGFSELDLSSVGLDV